MVEMELVYDGLKEVANKLGMTVEQFRIYRDEQAKKDPANNKKERYQLTDRDYGWTYFDTVEKKNICFSPRQWRAQRKFEAENKNNICTNF